MELLHTCVDLFKRSQLAVFNRALSMADIFDRAVSDYVGAIQDVYSSKDIQEHYFVGTERMFVLLEEISKENVYYCVAATAILFGFFAVHKIWKMFKTWKLTMQLNTGHGTVFYSSYTATNDECVQTEDDQNNPTSGQQDKKTKIPQTRFSGRPRVLRVPSIDARNQTTPQQRSPQKSSLRKLCNSGYSSLSPVKKKRSGSPWISGYSSLSPNVVKRKGPAFLLGPRQHRPHRQKQSSSWKKRRGKHDVRQSSTARGTAPITPKGLSTVQASPAQQKLSLRKQQSVPSLTRWGGVVNNEYKSVRPVVKISALPKRRRSIRRNSKQERRDDRTTTGTNCYLPGTKRVLNNIISNQNEHLKCLTTLTTNPLTKGKRESNVIESEVKDKSGNKNKKCRTCKKFRKASPRHATSKYFTLPQNKMCSLFYYVPQTPTKPSPGLRSDFNILAPTKTLPPANSHVGKFAVPNGNKPVKDTNMNKSGIRFDVDRNDDPRFIVKLKQTLYSVTDWPLIGRPQIDMSDCEDMQSVRMDANRDRSVPKINVMQTLKQLGDKKIANRMAENGTEGVHKTTDQSYSRRCNPSQFISMARNCECCCHHGNAFCGGDRRRDQQHVTCKQKKDDFSLSFDHQKYHNNVDNNLMDHKSSVENTFKKKSNIRPFRKESTTNKNNIVRTGKLLSKRSQLRKEYPTKCRGCRSRHPQWRNCPFPKTIRHFPLATLANTRELLSVDHYCSNAETSDPISTEMFHTRMENSEGYILSLAEHGKEDLTTVVPKDPKWLKENVPVCQEVGTDEVTLVVDRKHSKGFERDKKTDFFIKRCDKIKSNKWRHRHEPYKTVRPKHSRKVSSSRSSDATFTPCKRSSTKTSSPKYENVFWPPERFKTERVRLKHASRSESDDTLNGVFDHISVDSPKNKNNCSPSRGGERNLKTMTGESQIKQVATPQQADGTLNNYRQNVDACSKGLENTIIPRHTPKLKRYCHEGYEKIEIKTPSKILSHSACIYQTKGLELDRPQEVQLNTVLQCEQIDSEIMKYASHLPNVHRLNNRAHGSAISEGSSTSTNASHGRRRRRYLKEKRVRYPNFYKKHGGSTKEYSWANPCTSKGKIQNFVSLGIQTSDICLVNMAVQTSPALNPMISKRPAGNSLNKRSSQTCSGGKLVGNNNNWDFMTSGSKTPDLRHPDRASTTLRESRNDQIIVSSLDLGVIPGAKELSQLTSDEVACSRNEQEVVQNSGHFSPDINRVPTTCAISGWREKCFDANTESMSFGFTDNDEVKDGLVTISRFDHPTQQSPVKQVRRKQSMTPISHSPVDVKHELVAITPSSNKSWVTRPRWEDANIDEINRRVEKALRLRQELQQYRSGNYMNQQEHPDACSARRLGGTDLTNSYLAKDNNSTVSHTTSGYNTKTQCAVTHTHKSSNSTRNCDMKNAQKEDMINRDVRSSRPPPNTNGMASTEDLENPMSDVTDTLCSTLPFKVHQTESLILEDTGGGNEKVFGGQSKLNTPPIETDDSTLKPDRSHSFHEESSYTPVTSIVVKPSSVSSLSCLTFGTKAENDGHSVRKSHQSKNSPPIRISRMENVIQSHYPKLVGELVQALPQVPLSSFVEWFIETSHPGHFVSSEFSSSPDVAHDVKVTTNNFTSISTENDQSLLSSKRNPTCTDQVFAVVENGDNNRESNSVLNPEPFCRQIKPSDQGESPDMDRDCGIVSAADRVCDGVENAQGTVPSIRRILLTRDERDESDFDSSTTNDKRRVINIIRQSSDNSAVVHEDLTNRHGS